MADTHRPAAGALKRHLPLKADVLVILLVLREGDRHGYAIMRDALERSEGVVRLQPGAFYRVLKRLLESGLVEESDRRPAPDSDDERRRYYRLSRLGAGVLQAELNRLSRLVSPARREGASRRPRLA